MGDIGREAEKFGGGVGNFLGIGGAEQIGNGGSFRVSKEAALGEKEAINRMRNVANGKAPSITDLQYKQALDDIIKNQASAVASAQGVSNVGMLQRNAMLMGNQAGADLARESAAAKLSEQRIADSGLIQAAGAQRGVALNSAIAQQSADTAAAQNRAGFISNLAASGAQVLSDERLKENIKPTSGSASDSIESFMDALQSYSYNYKKDKAPNGKENPKGEVKSVMAQDLEKSDLGKQMVIDTPGGKMVDYAQGMAMMLAGLAELNKKTKELEKKKA
jgi:hypothetical protein